MGDQTIYRIGEDGSAENVTKFFPPELSGAEFSFSGANFAQINGGLIFPIKFADADGDTFNDWQLGRLNANGTLELIAENDGTPLYDIRALTILSGEYYFTADNGTMGQELYKINTLGKVEFVSEINPGSGHANVHGEVGGLYTGNGSYYFSAETDVGGEALYRITPAGTVELVSDLRADAGDSYIQGFLEFGGMLYFRADNGVTGSELYRIDVLNTVAPVTDLRSGAKGSTPDHLTLFNAALYFTATQDNGSREVMRLNIDGSIDAVTAIRNGSSGANPDSFFVFGDSLYFTAVDTQGNRRVFRLDENDKLDTLLYVGPGGTDFSVFGGQLYFSASEDSGSPDYVGLELYRASLDGTIELASDIRPGFQDSVPGEIISFASPHFEGGAGDDIIIGGAFDDTINGNGGNDRLSGLAGDDIINGGDGDDIIIGGAGADTMDGGDGVDTLVYSGSGAGVIVSLNPEQASGDSRAFANSAPAMGGEAEGDIVSNFENIIGSDNNDSLTGSSGVNHIDGGDGDDFIMGLAGADTLVGGAGVDTLDYSGSNAGVNIDLGNGTASGGHAEGDIVTEFENVSGSSFDDNVFGDAGANRLEGGDGNDVILGRAGADTLIGGEGDDTIIAGEGADAIDGGSGQDRIFLQGDEASVLGGTGFDYVFYDLYDGSGLTFALAGTGIEGAVGRDGADVFDASGVTGSVALYGNGGADTLTGAAFQDYIEGGDGADTINGGGGDDTIIAGEGADLIDGGDGDDTIYAGAGADAIDGGDGDDRIYIQGDETSILGGAGFDYLYYNNYDGSGLNFNLAGTGIDGVVGRGGVDVLNATGVMSSVALYGNGGDDTLIGGTGPDYLAGGDGNDIIVSGGGADTISAGAGDDTIYVTGQEFGINGGAGRDFVIYNVHDGSGLTMMVQSGIEGVVGRDGNDDFNAAGLMDAVTLIGNDGDDILVGGNASDSLFGDGGNDTMTGNGSADYFFIYSDFGNDIITDFTDNVDAIILNVAGLGSMSQFNVQQDGDDTVLTYGKDSIRLLDFDADALGANDIVFNSAAVVTTLDNDPFGGATREGEALDGNGLSLREAIWTMGADDSGLITFDSSLLGGTINWSGDALVQNNVIMRGEVTVSNQTAGTMFLLNTDGTTFVNDGLTINMDSTGVGQLRTRIVDAGGDDVTFINNGELMINGSDVQFAGDFSTGIEFSGDDFRLENGESGSIVSQGRYAIYASTSTPSRFPEAKDTVIVNEGLIQSTDDTVRLAQGHVINSGTIRSTGEFDQGGGTEPGEFADTVAFFGSLGAEYDMPFDGIGIVDNLEGGVIEGARAAIYFAGGGQVNNAGHISADSVAIWAQGYVAGDPVSFTLNNSGTIESAGNSYNVSPEVLGTIRISSFRDLTEAQINNSGTISSPNIAINTTIGTALINEEGGIIDATIPVAEAGFADGAAGIAFSGADGGHPELSLFSQFRRSFPTSSNISEFEYVSEQDYVLHFEFNNIAGTSSSLAISFTEGGQKFGLLDLPFYEIRSPNGTNIGAEIILPLVDIAATIANGSRVIFQISEGGAFIFPDSINVETNDRGVLTVTGLDTQNVEIVDVNGNPAYSLTEGLNLTDTVTNDGLINGDVLTGLGNDIVRNNNILNGDVETDVGDDKVENRGTLNGDVDAGDGMDTFNNIGAASLLNGDVDLGAGDDIFRNTGTVTGDVDTGEGKDDVIISGTLTGDFDSGEGDDDVTVLFGTVNGDLATGTGNDELTINGTVNGDVNSGSGDDTVGVLLGGTINGDLASGDGVDNVNVNVQGQISGGLNTGSGDDVVVNGGQITGDIDLGGGNDSFDGSLSNTAQRIFGGSGDDAITGGSADDLLVGGDGADTLLGMGGNDLISAGSGADIIDGGAGDDQIYIQGDEASIQGGSGFDYVVYDVYDGSGLTFNLFGTGIEGVVGRDGADVLLANGVNVAVALYGNGGSDILIGGSAADTLDGGDGADHLFSSGGADIMFGGAGNDELHVQGGEAFVNGGTGFDYVIYDLFDGSGLTFSLLGTGIEGAVGRDGADVFLAGGMADAVGLYGNGGNDILVGGTGGDTLDGGEGNDRIYSNGGGDVLLGRGGDDELHIQGDEAFVSGGDGFDYVVYDVFDGSGLTFSLFGTGVEGAVGRDGADVFLAGGMTDAVGLYGNGGNDILVGGRDGDTLDGGEGNDRIYSNGGGDVILGRGGNDEIHIQGGEAFVSGGDGIDYVIYDVFDGSGLTFSLAGTGIEGAVGRDGADVFDASGVTAAVNLYGNGGADTLTGGSGSDILSGDAGDDILTGNGGNDFFLIYARFGADTIVDFTDGSDTILVSIAGVDDIGQLTITQDGADALVTYQTNSIRLSNFDTADLDAADFIFNPPPPAVGNEAAAQANVAVASDDQFDFSGLQDVPLPEAINLAAILGGDLGDDLGDQEVETIDVSAQDIACADADPIALISVPDDDLYLDLIA